MSIAMVSIIPTIIATALAGVMLSSSGVRPVLSLIESKNDIVEDESAIRKPSINPNATIITGKMKVIIQNDLFPTAVLYSFNMISFNFFMICQRVMSWLQSPHRRLWCR